ncbi:MAG: hypothetical protein WKG07_47165 [Hymenobacter sp.]
MQHFPTPCAWPPWLLLLAATGCEKVVNLNLKTSPSQLVIEEIWWTTAAPAG